MSRIELTRSPWIKSAVKNRLPQFLVFVIMLMGYIFAILAGLVGTPVGSHNFSIVFVWIAWWAILILAANLTDAEKWNVVSYLWQSNTTRAALAEAKQLYAQNCAACHGEKGGGNGVFADDLAKAGNATIKTMTGAQEMAMQQPADFSDPKRMLGASPAILQGKILRGGMGTGMPMWGSIFTEKQIWDLVAYLYSFQFEYQH